MNEVEKSTLRSFYFMKLFVGRLPYEFEEESLRELFEKAGTVTSAKIIIDRYTNRSRGFGFVEMASEDEGRAAIEQFDGSDVGGRAIVVKQAHDTDQERGGGNGASRPPRRQSTGGFGRGPGGGDRGERSDFRSRR